VLLDAARCTPGTLCQPWQRGARWVRSAQAFQRCRRGQPGARRDPQADRKRCAGPAALTRCSPRAGAGRVVGVLGARVPVAARALLPPREALVRGGAGAGELLRADQAWDGRPAGAPRAENLLGRRLVAAALEQAIHALAGLVDGPPQLGRLPIDREDACLPVPRSARTGAPPTERGRVRVSNLPPPWAQRGGGHARPAFRQPFFASAGAKVAAEGAPHGGGNAGLRQAQALVGRTSSLGSHAPRRA
jgi:hypothetical protein